MEARLQCRKKKGEKSPDGQREMMSPQEEQMRREGERKMERVVGASQRFHLLPFVYDLL